MRILGFTAENFKRLSIVNITPAGNIVEITGANANGKSSVLDGIWAALGGKDAAPEKPIRHGHKSARIEVKLGDGNGPRYIVERTFTDKDSYLKITDAEGSKHSSPQKILDGLMGAIGYDPLAVMRMKPKEQFELLRDLTGLGETLGALDRKRATIFDQRTEVNRDLSRAKSVAESIIVPDDLPDEQPDVAAITDRLAGVDIHNRRILGAKSDLDRMIKRATEAERNVAEATRAIEQARGLLKASEEARDLLKAEEVKLCERYNAQPQPLDASAIRAELDAANLILDGFRKQKAKIDADGTVTTLERESTEKTEAIKAIDEQKQKAIAGAQMPVDGLGFADGIVTFNGIPLAQASAAEQLRVSASIGAALNPRLRVMLARDGSLLDSKSLALLAQFAEERDTQIWLERVDESGEVGVVMVDGHVKGQEAEVEAFEAAERAEPSAPEVVKVDPERLKRATDYLETQLAALSGAREVGAADRLNAEIKVKLKNFPDILAQQWTPAYLTKVKQLKPKK